MKIKEVTNFLEQYAPLEYQESYDNCGLIIGDANAEIKGALITLDCIESVIDEAIATGNYFKSNGKVNQSKLAKALNLNRSTIIRHLK